MTDDGWRCLGRSSPITSPMPPRKGYASPIFTIIKDPFPNTNQLNQQTGHQSFSRPATPTLYPSSRLISKHDSTLLRKNIYNSTPSLSVANKSNLSLNQTARFSNSNQQLNNPSFGNRSRPSSSLASGTIVLQPVRKDFTQQTLPREKSSKKDSKSKSSKSASPVQHLRTDSAGDQQPRPGSRGAVSPSTARDRSKSVVKIQEAADRPRGSSREVPRRQSTSPSLDEQRSPSPETRRSIANKKNNKVESPKTTVKAKSTIAIPVTTRKQPTAMTGKRIETSIVQKSSSTRVANRGYVANQYSSTTIRIENSPGDRRSPVVVRRSDSAIEKKEAKQTRTSEMVTKTRNFKSSQQRIIIKNGKVVNEDGFQDADVYIEEGIIRQVGPNLIVPGGCRVVDARGHYVIPGGVDPHTHLQLPFMGTRTVDDFYSGTRAAVAGGTTTIIDFVIAPESGLIDGYEQWRSWADEKVCCDYGLHVAVTKFVEGKTDKEMELLVKEKGVNSFKVFSAYKGTLQLQDSQMIRVFDVCKRIGALPMVHAENAELIDFLSKKLLKMGVTGPEGHLQSRPEEVEAEATHRVITMADQVGVPVYIVHVMSRSAADEVARAKSRGQVVFGETLASAVAIDGTHHFNRCWRHAAAHVMSPPLRPDKSTPEYLTNLLGSGQLQVTGSDHAVFNAQQKSLGQKDFTKIPNGVNGIQERMAVLWEKGVKAGKLTIPDFVAVTSSNAAKLFNIYPRKGKIAPGSDADIVVWGRNPRVISKENHLSGVDFNIFEGMSTEFNPIVVIVNGKVVLDEEGRLTATQGVGRYIPCAPFANIAFSRSIMRDLNAGPIKVDRSGAIIVEPTPKPIGGDVVKNGKRPSLTPLITSVVDAVVTSSGPPSPVSSNGSTTPGGGFHKIHTRSGVRSQQDSGFKITGEQIDDDRASKPSVKMHHPPGGKSSGLW